MRRALVPLGLIVALVVVVAPAAGADRLLAPASMCPGATAAGIPAVQQEAAMACLVEYARRHNGVAPGRASGALARSAQMKADLVARCGVLTHSACGAPWNAGLRRVGFRGLAFENLAAGSGRLATARAAMTMWLGSSGHRVALLDGRVTVFGVGMRPGVRVNGWRGSVWALHLGRR